MEEILSLQEIKERYRGEWLLIAYTKLDDAMAAVAGRVLAHSPNRDEVYRALLNTKDQNIAVDYAGVIPEDLAVAL